MKRLLYILTFVCTWGYVLKAQTVLNTNAVLGAPNNGSGACTFNFENTNGFPVEITEIASFVGTAGTATCEVWVRTTPINGIAPGPITVANGWTLEASDTFTAATANVLTTFLTGLNINIPAGANYGICVAAYSGTTGRLRYFGTGTTAFSDTISGGGCNIYVGSNVSYGYTATFPSPIGSGTANHPRAFDGTVTFAALGPCVSPPTAGTSTATPTVACTGSNITLGLTGNTYGLGQTYQWQSAPAISGPYTDIDTALTNSALITVATSTSYYRCAVTCSGITDTSSPVLVNVNGSLPGGVYTINSALATSGTNYQSFADVLSALSCGISGPVVFNVIPGSGPYTEQVILPPISGASATNTITFNGNSEVLTFSSANTNERAVIKLNGADHVIINEFTLTATGTYGFGVQLLNNADSNIISGCVINIDATSTSTNYAGIVISNSATSAIGTGNSACDNNLIIGNTVSGGYYGITLVANGATDIIYNNQVIDNDIRDFYQYGIYLNGNNGTLVEGNDISRPTRTVLTTFYGVYHTSVSSNVVVSANRIHNPFDGNPASTSAAYGVYHTNTDATLGNENLVVNNLIYNFNGSGTQNGFLTGGSDYTKYYHNTISLDDNTTTCVSCATRGFYLQTNPATGLELINNNFTITRTNGGESQGIYFAVAGSSFTSDYNNIYVASSGSANDVGYINGAGQTTLAAWIAASANDSNSLSVNPLYTNPGGGNFAPSNPALNNQGTPVGIATDITTAPRDVNTPDIGAYEFDVAATDAGASGITTTSCPGTDSVYVTVQNFGLTTINSVVVNCVINGVPTSNSGNTFAVSIPASGSASVSVGTTTFVAGATYTATAFTSLPNGSADTNNPNDTTTTTINIALTGNYTINASAATSGTNFQSFTDAANALNTLGICGPVVIDVVPGYGPYNEQIVFNQINGASSVNTITINGNGEVLTFNPTSTLKYVLRLDGTDYMTIDSLKIVGTNATYGFGILLSTSADYNVIRDCEIDLSMITSTTASNSCGICASSSVTSPTTGGNTANFNEITNNVIKGGASGGPYYGITLYGTTGAVGCNANIVSGNTITDFYNNGIRMNLTSACEIVGNDLSRPTLTTAGTLEGIYVTGATNPKTKILKNRVHNSHGGNPTNTSIAYPIDISSDGGGATQEILVANNAVYNINHNGSAYAIYISGSLYSNYYHNSISLDNTAATGTTTSRGIYILGTSDSINVKNNVVSVTRGGTGVMYGLYYTSLAANLKSDFNDVYVNTSTGSGFFGYNGSAQPTLADWRATSLRDSSSQDLNPLFASLVSGDLTPSSSGINNIGENLTSVVPDDILGTSRLSTPDPGAFEFTPSLDDAGVTAVTSSTCTGTDSVYVTVQNFGAAILNSVTVTVTSNGIPSSLSGSIFIVSLLPGEDTVLNLGTVTFVAGNVYTFSAFTSLPNGAGDANTANDSTALVVNLGLSGSYTINSAVTTSGTNFQTFTDAVTALNNYGLCGPVIITVAPGSGPYNNQQITLNQLIGSSAVNTVTFKGNNEVFKFLSTNTNSRAGIKLNGADYVTIDSLVIVADGDSTGEYGWGLHLTAGADYNNITNCTVYTDTLSTSTTNYAGIVMTGSNTSLTLTGNTGNYNRFEGNTIRGGYYSITLVGQSTSVHNYGNTIENNSLTHYHSAAINSDNQDTITVENNYAEQRIGGNSTGYGFNLGYNGYASVKKNRVITRGSSTNYGIYTNNGYSSPALYTEISNNFVSCLGGTGTTYGIYSFNAYYANIFHNSVNVTGGSSTAGRAIYLNSSSTGAYGFVNVLSNIGVNTGPGYAVEISNGAATLGYVTSMQNNDWYATGAVLGRYNNVNSASLGGWTASSSFDSSSVSMDPVFVSPADLHASLPFLNDRGALGTGVADDIDGDIRCPNGGCAGNTLRPDIGADEFLGTPITVDIGVNALVSPAQTACYTNSEQVIVQVKNFNTQLIDFSLNPVTVYTSVTGPNGVVFTPVILSTGILGPDSTQNITIAANYDMSLPGTYSFTFYTSETSDANNTNDTISNAGIVFSVGTIANTFAEVCSGSTFELKMDGITGPVLWQSYDDNNSIWISETGTGFDSVVYHVSPTTTTLYRALVCGTYPSATDTILPVSVAAPSVFNDTACSGQTAQLIAAGVGFKNWYTSLTGGNPVFTGDTLSLLATTDTIFYVDASVTLAGNSGVLKITELDLGTVDAIEIENLSSSTINTTGWVVAISNNYSNINAVNPILWNLPSSIAPGQILTRDENAWGNNILWNPGNGSTRGWAMILDNTGAVVDFAIWDNWPAGALNTFNPTINGFSVTVGNQWVGDTISTIGIGTQTLARIGSSDNNDRNDFVFQSGNIGTHNPNLSNVFSGGNCSSIRVPVSVKVEPSPIVNLGADTTQCEGTVTLNAGNTGNTFAWNTTENTQSIMVSTSGVYVVTVTSPNGCAGTDVINVNIAPYPVANLGNDTSLCGGIIILSTSNIGNTFNWSTGSNASFITVTSSGIYSVTVTTPSGCSSRDTITIAVNPAASVTLINDTAQCGGSVTLDAGNTGVSYMWSSGANTQTITVSQTGNYSVIVTDANSCTATDSANVAINFFPSVSLGPDTTQCGGNIVLDAGNIGSSYLWSNSATSQSVVISNSGAYSVEVTSPDGCATSDTVNVTINANPIITFNVADTLCVDANTIALSASPAGGTFSGSGVTGSSFSPGTAGVGTKTITYSYTDNNGCSASATDNIEVVMCVGIAETQNDLLFSFFPNPSSGAIQLSFASADIRSVNIEVFAADGKLIRSLANLQNNDVIDLREVASGIYTARITSAGSSVVKRIIIE